jgi:L-threonylcarbamoyladenylate synthase
MKIFQASQINEAASAIKSGGLVAFPTETVYGLGASVFLPQAIQRIFHVKGRPQDNPLIVHISSFKQLELIAGEIPEAFFRLAAAFFPGPLTVILPKKDAVPQSVSANLSTIGVRMPSHWIAQKLIDAVGVPLVAPSANLSGKPSSTTVQHVIDDFGNAIEGVLDGGPCQYCLESTVVSLFPKPLILRPGAISQKQLENVLQCSVAYAADHADRPLSPGMKYRHYAPKAKVILFETDKQLMNYLDHSPTSQRLVVTALRPENLYAIFRQADKENYEEILVICDEQMRSHRALINRLRRAAKDSQ